MSHPSAPVVAHPTNALASAASAYLRSAMHQPVRWREWGAEAFAEAKRLDKPILLDIGAVWCHWCHVMDRESYENPRLASVVNENFIAVKVDRDERPDVDARYQAAVQAMAGQGGWPLTALLTPDGRPFFGGTYFPPDDRYGRPGFRRVLETLAGVWKERRSELEGTAAQVVNAIDHGESFSGRGGSLGPEIVDALVGSALGNFDKDHGGFGNAPKFPHPAAVDLLVDVAARTGSAPAREAWTRTLAAQARGGMYDHLGGGFHRYSVDERWGVPHFEKMLYDNAGLLANYAHAFATDGDPEWARTARDILRWMDGKLSDRARGGFYASQDADISLDDDGDYFTWTQAEFAEVLSGDELRFALAYYGVRAAGDMHHNPAKCVLRTDRSAAAVESSLGLKTGLLPQVHGKLLEARERRPEPFIDRTVYTGWNGMAVSAYLAAAEALGDAGPRAFALQTLDRVLAEAWDGSRLKHVVAYADGHTPASPAPGVLEDYAYLAHACLDAWAATGAFRYWQAGEALTRAMAERFADRVGGGFFDTEQTNGEQLGVLGTRRKPLQDAPTPSGNASAAAALLRVAALNGEESLRELAEDTREAFGGVAAQFGLYAASYGLALERWLLAPVQVVVVGEDSAAEELAGAAARPWAVEKAVVRLSCDQISRNELPPALAETLPHLREEGSFAMVCKGAVCLPPVRGAAELKASLGA